MTRVVPPDLQTTAVRITALFRLHPRPRAPPRRRHAHPVVLDLVERSRNRDGGQLVLRDGLWQLAVLHDHRSYTLLWLRHRPLASLEFVDTDGRCPRRDALLELRFRRFDGGSSLLWCCKCANTALPLRIQGVVDFPWYLPLFLTAFTPCGSPLQRRAGGAGVVSVAVSKTAGTAAGTAAASPVSSAIVGSARGASASRRDAPFRA